MLPERVRAIAQIGHVGTRISARTHETPTPRYFAAASDRSMTRSKRPYGPRSFTSTIAQLPPRS